MSAKGSNFKEDDSPLPSRSYCSTYVVNSCTFKHVEVPLDVGAVALDGLQDGLHLLHLISQAAVGAVAVIVVVVLPVLPSKTLLTSHFVRPILIKELFLSIKHLFSLA